MKKKTIFSLCINVQKIRELKTKNRHNTIISHPICSKWLSIYRKQFKKVRFYDNNGLEEVSFEVMEIARVTQLHEDIIRIKLGKRI